jgi:hypothetical protein
MLHSSLSKKKANAHSLFKAGGAQHNVFAPLYATREFPLAPARPHYNHIPKTKFGARST